MLLRKDLKALCYVNAIIVLVLLWEALDLVALLHDDSGRDAILRSETETPLAQQRSQTIPRIIHQTYKNETCPEVWRECQQSIRDLHPDYEYLLWTDESSRDFIATNYAWFLPTFDAYPYPIMRADAIRYFILYHFGGIYIDLDKGVTSRLDPLLAFPAWLRKTNPTGVSNDVMACTPKHPFFGGLIDALPRYNRNWIVPYITVMYSTGPLFVSVVWNNYMRVWRNENTISEPSDGIRILIPKAKDSIVKPESDFFYTVKGSSWHANDAEYILYMKAHWIGFTVFFFGLGFFLLLVMFYIELTLISLFSLAYKKTFRWVCDRKGSMFKEKYQLGEIGDASNGPYSRRGSREALLQSYYASEDKKDKFTV